jgi:hypothetical protein
MKKIEDLVFTVTKFFSSARKFEQMQFFYQLLEIDTWNTYGILFSVEQMTFFCRAVDIFKKSVEQSRFEQLHFEQLTLTRKFLPKGIFLSLKDLHCLVVIFTALLFSEIDETFAQLCFNGSFVTNHPFLFEQSNN